MIGGLTSEVRAIPSSGAQNAVRLVGYAASATEVEFQPYRDTVFQAYNSALTSASSATVEHYADSDANQDTKTTFVNRANGTRDIVAGVTL